MTYTARVGVSPGIGVLARRGRSCLYIPDPAHGSSDDAVSADLVEQFLIGAADAEAAVVDFVLQRNDEAPRFVLAVWPDAAAGDGIRLVVRGDVTVTTDIASVPSLNGAGSSTWVEHRVRYNPGDASIASGDDTAPSTDLVDGVVPAGGFLLALVDAESVAPTTSLARPQMVDDRSAPASSSTQREEPARSTEPAPAATDIATGTSTGTATAESPGATESPDTAAPALPLSGLDALRAAAGGPGPSEPVPIDDVPTGTPQVVEPEASAQPASRSVPPSVAFPPEPDPSFDPSPASRHEPIEGGPPGPPAFPGETDPADDPEATILPGEHDVLSLSGRSTDDLDRLTHARLCAENHPNPPHRTSCIACGVGLDMNEPPVTVEQPVIAVAVLPSGERLDLNGVLVFGRNPRLDAARCDDGLLVPISAHSSMSRTHAVIRTEGWSITVTDCGSQGGTALVTPDADDPVPLAAWTPHEVAGGDTIYLGGPTAVRIVDVPG